MNPSSILSSIFPSTASTTFSWTLVVEALAELKEVDTSVLQVPITEVPDFTSHCSESILERIALKYLEDWLDPGWPGPPLPSVLELISAPGAGRGISMDRSSEEVLLILLQKVATLADLEEEEAELFRHDLHQFILKKKASLPKCSIEMLKHSTCDGSSQAVLFLKEQSCLSGVDQVDYNADEFQRAKNLMMKVSNEFHLPKLLSVAPAPAKAIFQENPSRNIQQPAQQSEGQPQLLQQISAVPATGNGKVILQEDPPGPVQRSAQQSDGVQILKHMLAAPATDNGNTVLRLQEDPSGSERQRLPHTVSYDGCRNVSGGDNIGTHGDSAQVSEPSCMPLPIANKNKNMEHAHVNVSETIVHPPLCGSSVATGEQNMSKPTSDGPGCRSSSFKIDQNDELIAAVRCGSSRIPLNQDSMEDNRTESDFCMKCDDTGGLLLTCSGSSCSVAVHKSCMESTINFDENGGFYCPFCLFTQAAITYCTAKKRYSQAKKALAAFMGKDSVTEHHKQSSRREILREQSRGRKDDNVNNDGKTPRPRGNMKTMEHHNQKGVTTNSDNGKLSRLPVTSESVERFKVPNNAGESSVAVHHQDIMQNQLQRQTHAAVVINNGESVCASGHVNVDVPLTKVENGIVDGCRSTEFLEHRKPEEQQIAEACETTSNDTSANVEAEICRIDEIHNVSRGNVECRNINADSCSGIKKQKQEELAKFVMEQSIGHSADGEAASLLIGDMCAKRRKLNQLPDNGVGDCCQKIGAVKQQLVEGISTAGNAKVACEEGETSRNREIHAVSQANLKSVLHDDCSNIQKWKNLGQAEDVIGPDTRKSPERTGLPLETSEKYVKRRRLHAATPSGHHPQLSTNKDGGKPVFCEGQIGGKPETTEPQRRNKL